MQSIFAVLLSAILLLVDYGSSSPTSSSASTVYHPNDVLKYMDERDRQQLNRLRTSSIRKINHQSRRDYEISSNRMETKEDEVNTQNMIIKTPKGTQIKVLVWPSIGGKPCDRVSRGFDLLKFMQWSKGIQRNLFPMVFDRQANLSERFINQFHWLHKYANDISGTNDGSLHHPTILNQEQFAVLIVKTGTISLFKMILERLHELLKLLNGRYALDGQLGSDERRRARPEVLLYFDYIDDFDDGDSQELDYSLNGRRYPYDYIYSQYDFKVLSMDVNHLLEANEHFIALVNDLHMKYSQAFDELPDAFTPAMKDSGYSLQSYMDKTWNIRQKAYKCIGMIHRPEVVQDIETERLMPFADVLALKMIVNEGQGEFVPLRRLLQLIAKTARFLDGQENADLLRMFQVTETEIDDDEVVNASFDDRAFDVPALANEDD